MTGLSSGLSSARVSWQAGTAAAAQRWRKSGRRSACSLGSSKASRTSYTISSNTAPRRVDTPKGDVI